jgi:hypothetical protein
VRSSKFPISVDGDGDGDGNGKADVGSNDILGAAGVEGTNDVLGLSESPIVNEEGDELGISEIPSSVDDGGNVGTSVKFVDVTCDDVGDDSKQQLRNTPSNVGQQSPVRARIAQRGFVPQDANLDGAFDGLVLGISIESIVGMPLSNMFGAITIGTLLGRMLGASLRVFPSISTGEELGVSLALLLGLNNGIELGAARRDDGTLVCIKLGISLGNLLGNVLGTSLDTLDRLMTGPSVGIELG